MSTLEWLVLVGFVSACYMLYRIEVEIRLQGQKQTEPLIRIAERVGALTNITALNRIERKQ